MPTGTAAPPGPDPSDRLDVLEARVARLERELDRAPTERETVASDLDERFWVLTGLKARLAVDEQHEQHENGAVVFAGSVQVADGRAEWQQGAMTADLLETDWAELSGSLAALGHPVRCRLLQAVLNGTHGPAELAALPGIGTSGQVYHHLRALTAAGWLRGGVRGTWQLPPERVVPLLVLLTTVRT